MLHSVMSDYQCLTNGCRRLTVVIRLKLARRHGIDGYLEWAVFRLLQKFGQSDLLS